MEPIAAVLCVGCGAPVLLMLTFCLVMVAYTRYRSVRMETVAEVLEPLGFERSAGRWRRSLDGRLVVAEFEHIPGLRSGRGGREAIRLAMPLVGGPVQGECYAYAGVRSGNFDTRFALRGALAEIVGEEERRVLLALIERVGLVSVAFFPGGQAMLTEASMSLTVGLEMCPSVDTVHQVLDEMSAAAVVLETALAQAP